MAAFLSFVLLSTICAMAQRASSRKTSPEFLLQLRLGENSYKNGETIVLESPVDGYYMDRYRFELASPNLEANDLRLLSDSISWKGATRVLDSGLAEVDSSEVDRPRLLVGYYRALGRDDSIRVVLTRPGMGRRPRPTAMGTRTWRPHRAVLPLEARDTAYYDADGLPRMGRVWMDTFGEIVEKYGMGRFLDKEEFSAFMADRVARSKAEMDTLRRFMAGIEGLADRPYEARAPLGTVLGNPLFAAYLERNTARLLPEAVKLADRYVWKELFLSLDLPDSTRQWLLRKKGRELSEQDRLVLAGDSKELAVRAWSARNQAASTMVCPGGDGSILCDGLHALLLVGDSLAWATLTALLESGELYFSGGMASHAYYSGPLPPGMAAVGTYGPPSSLEAVLLHCMDGGDLYSPWIYRDFFQHFFKGKYSGDLPATIQRLLVVRMVELHLYKLYGIRPRMKATYLDEPYNYKTSYTDADPYYPVSYWNMDGARDEIRVICEFAYDGCNLKYMDFLLKSIFDTWGEKMDAPMEHRR